MGRSLYFAPRTFDLTLVQRLGKINWLMVLTIMAIAGIGFAMLYSVAGGSWDPWAKNQAIRFSFALIIMIGIGAATRYLLPMARWMNLAMPCRFWSSMARLIHRAIADK